MPAKIDACPKKGIFMKDDESYLFPESLAKVRIADSKSVDTLLLGSQVIPVTYPSHWLAPVCLSPFAKTIEEETLSWMGSLGLIQNNSCLNHLRNMEPRHYAGYSHSMASYEHALLYCKYITMWLLWDDDCVEVAKDYAEVEWPLVALAGDEYPDSFSQAPYVLAFKHLGDEYERLGASRAWRQRFADKMKEWAKRAIDEEKVRRQESGLDARRSFEEALSLRAITVGIRPNSLPLERAVGIELPKFIHTHPLYQRLIDKAALICCIINDVVGVAKDLKNNQITSNLVLYHSLYFKTSLHESYSGVLSIHDQAVKDYDKTADTLFEFCPEPYQERLATFISHLRYMDTGFGYWHRDCVRYQDLVAVENSQAFRIAIRREPCATLS